MADQIGPLTIKVTVASDGVSTGLQAAAQAFNQGLGKIASDATTLSAGLANIFTGDITKGVRQLGMGATSLVGDIGKLAEKALGNPGRFIAEDIIGGLAVATSKIPVIGGLLSLPFEGLASAGKLVMDTYDKGSENILMLGRAARATGTDIGEIQVLGSVVGDLDLAVTLMHRLQSEAQKAAIEGEGASNAFTRMGINTQKLLLEGGGIDVWKALSQQVRTRGAGALSEVDEIFGKRMGANAIEALAKGPEFYEKRAGLYKQFGADADEGTLTLIKRAKQASAELGIFKEGFVNQVTIGLAPVIAGLAEMLPKLSEMGISAKGLSGFVTEAGFKIIDIGLMTVDFFRKAWADPWGTLKESFMSIKGWLTEKATAMGESVGESIAAGIRGGFRPSFMKPSRSFEEVEAEVGIPKVEYGPSVIFRNFAAFAAAREQRAALARPYNFDYSAFAGLGTAVGKAFEKVSGESALSERWRNVMDQMLSIRLAANEMQGIDPFLKWTTSAQRFAESFDSPLDKIRKQAMSLSGQLSSFPDPGEALERGVSEADVLRGEKIRQKIAQQGGYGLLQALRSATGAPLGSQFTGAAEAGSREAYSEALKYNAPQFDVMQEIEMRLRELNLLQEANNKEGEKASDQRDKIVVALTGQSI